MALTIRESSLVVQLKNTGNSLRVRNCKVTSDVREKEGKRGEGKISQEVLNF